MTPELIEAVNAVMTKPIRMMSIHPYLRKVTLRIEPRFGTFDITIERWYEPTRFYWQAVAIDLATGDELEEYDQLDHDGLGAYPDPLEAFYGAAATMTREHQRRESSAA